MLFSDSSLLTAFWEMAPEHLDARQSTLAWYQQVAKADRSAPADVKADFGNASTLNNGRVVFNIAGNKYRLVVWINYAHKVVYIRFIGTHRQYHQIDAQTMWLF